MGKLPTFQAFNPNTGEGRGRLGLQRVLVQPEIHSETMSQNKYINERWLSG